MPQSHGSGRFAPSDLAGCGEGCVFEEGVLVFHPEHVWIGARVYVGHRAMLKGYYKGRLDIGDDCWIGQNAFIHAGGGVRIEERVGIGPGVQILSSQHRLPHDPSAPVMDGALDFAEVVLEAGCDIGVGAVVLPGVRIGRAAVVGAGSVVTRSVQAGEVVAGNPARRLRHRGDTT